MKRITFLCISLLCIFVAQAQTVEKRFPDKQTFCYTNAQRSGLLKVQFYYDNQNDPVCSAFAGSTSQFYWWATNNGNGLEFHGFKYAPEAKAQPNPYGGFPIVTYTGRIIKEKNNQAFTISPDYNCIDFNGNVYNTRLSQQEYQQLWSQMFGDGGGGTPTMNSGSGNTGGGGYNAPTQQNTRCKYCHGSGKCNSCNGKGYKFNSYSGHNDTCPSCNGNGRCFNCYGTGQQR